MDIFEYDSAEGVELLCGVDEAGRGPLAGDCYAAAVILPKGCYIEGLDDSKKLTEKKRELLYDKIIEVAVAYGVGIASVDEVDSVNILQANFLAMRRAVSQLVVKPKLVLVDGNQNPRLDIHSRCVVKGDGTSACIAAASILAKVSRDRYMVEVDKSYPQYQFSKHKGYGTALHYAMLDEHGVSKVHRLSFLRKYLSDGESKQKQRGRIGEQVATEFLLKNGYSIIGRNFGCVYGELDIIATINDLLVVVEVKARSEGQAISAADAVTVKKQRRIIQSTAHYIKTNGIEKCVRFDVVEVYFLGEENKICRVNHIENAFTGDGSSVFV